MRASWQRILTALVVAAAAGYAGFLLAPLVMPARTQTGPGSALTTTHRHGQVGLKVGDYPPNFTLVDIHGHTVTLSSLRGHAVWLNFWATWCPYCRKEMPDMQKIANHYGNRIDIYGIDIQETRPTVITWLKAHAIHYDILLDTTGGVATQYDVSKLPTSIFIGKNGRITAIHVGEFLSLSSMKPDVTQAMAQ